MSDELIAKLPYDVVAIERIDGTWRFKIEFRVETVPASLLLRHYTDDRLLLHSANSIYIVWDEQWMHSIPEGLEGHRCRDLAKIPDDIVDPDQNVIWLQEPLLYRIGDDEKKHICLGSVCLDSRGTRCPILTAASTSRELANRASIDEESGPELFKKAVEHLGSVVQSAHNNYPNDTSRMTAAILALRSSDNPFRRLVRA